MTRMSTDLPFYVDLFMQIAGPIIFIGMIIFIIVLVTTDNHD